MIDFDAVFEFIQQFKIAAGSIGAIFVGFTGWIYRRYIRRKKDYLYSDDALNEANIKITELRRKNMNKEGENMILYSFALKVAVKCPDCAQSTLDEMPKSIKRKILEALKIQENEA